MHAIVGIFTKIPNCKTLALSFSNSNKYLYVCTFSNQAKENGVLIPTKGTQAIDITTSIIREN